MHTPPPTHKYPHTLKHPLPHPHTHTHTTAVHVTKTCRQRRPTTLHVRLQATLPWNVERKKKKKGRKIKLLLVLHHNFAAQHTIFKPWLADRWYQWHCTRLYNLCIDQRTDWRGPRMKGTSQAPVKGMEQQTHSNFASIYSLVWKKSNVHEHYHCVYVTTELGQPMGCVCIITNKVGMYSKMRVVSHANLFLLFAGKK